MRQYKTIQGDTWDTVSYRVYGSEFYTNELLESNRDKQTFAVFSAGVVLNIPDIDIAIDTELPPWERIPGNNEPNFNTDLLNLVENDNPNYPNILSYRLVERYTKRMTLAVSWPRDRINQGVLE